MIQVPNLLTRLFKDKTEVAIFFTAFLVEIAFGLYLVYRWGHTFAIGDAPSHLYIASTVINNGVQNNFANLGTTWLPLVHILVMPLVLIRPLYATGFAGTIVSALMTGGICVLIYRLGKALGIFVLAPLALFMANIITLTYGAVPTMEQTALFFTLLSVYYFVQYWKGDDVKAFMKSSLALILGTLTRYEVWVVAFLIVVFYILRELKNGKKYRLAYIHTPLWGIFAWLFWNLAIFKDPLFFLSNPWIPARGHSPFVGTQLFALSGLLALPTVFFIAVSLIRKRDSAVMSVLLLSPIFLHLSRPMLGSLGLTIHWITEVRYLYVGYLGLVMAPFLFLQTFRTMRKKLIVIIVPLLCVSLIVAYPQQKNFLTSAPSAHGTIEFATINEWLREVKEVKDLVNDQRILMSAKPHGFNHLYSTSTNTPAYVIIDAYDGSLYIEAMDKPWDYCSFVLIDRLPNDPIALEMIKDINDYYNGKFFIYRYYNDNAWRSEFLEHYKLVLETEHSLLYRLA